MKRKLLASAFSTLCGWVCGWICLTTIYFFGNQQYKFDHMWTAVSSDLGGFFLMGFFIVPAWLFVFAPLYLTIPNRSFLWNRFVCVPLGAFAGVVILLSPVAYTEVIVYHSTFSDLVNTWPLSLPAAVVGSVTSLVGKLKLGPLESKA